MESHNDSYLEYEKQWYVFSPAHCVQQWSLSLLLESYRPADFSSNPGSVHLSVIIK